MYTEKVMDHFTNPRNVGELPNADGIGKIGDSKNEITIFMYIKVRDNIIVDIKFKTFGCAASIATSSITTELAKGKTIDQAINLSRDDIIQTLDGLPNNKMHCSDVALRALNEAIKDYKSNINPK